MRLSLTQRSQDVHGTNWYCNLTRVLFEAGPTPKATGRTGLLSSQLGRLTRVALWSITSLAACLWTARAAYPTSWVPGVPGGIPFVPIVNSVTDFGAVGDGVNEDSGAFQAAIDAVPSGGGAVFVPPGTYLLKSSISIGPHTVLRGAGAAVTHLRFDLGGRSENPIEIVTYDLGSWVDAVDGFDLGSTVITTSNASQFSPPTFAIIEQENDPELMYTDPEWNQPWAQNAVGQVVRITGKNGNLLSLEDPLRIGFDAARDPRVRPATLVEHAGVEDLHISRLDSGYGITIYLRNAAWSWVRGVESEMATRSHIETAWAYRCEIRRNFIHHAQDYGVGGVGYGVHLMYATSGCLVEDNIFDSLRHAAVVSVGSNGNVIAYNSTVNPHWEGVYLLPDVTLHGHYPFMNLVEGNVADKIAISDYWGPSGPRNTLLRNCVRTHGIRVLDHSHNQWIIGNSLPVADPENTIDVDDSVLDTIVHGNFVSGAVQWDPSEPDHSIPDSSYLAAPPSFYSGVPWPSTGGNLGSACFNPASIRWDGGQSTPGPTAPLFANGFESGDTEDWSATID